MHPPRDSATTVLPDRPSERWITDTVAAIAQQDASFAVQLAGALLRTVATQDDVAGDRAHLLLKHLPRRRLALLNEYPACHDRLVDIVRRVHRSRIDWLFMGASFALAVEVKTRATTGFQPFQLANYQRVLRENGAPYSGLLALTTVPPFNDELLRPRRRFVLGYVLWREAAQRLEAVSPRKEAAVVAWKHILKSVLP